MLLVGWLLQAGRGRAQGSEGGREPRETQSTELKDSHHVTDIGRHFRYFGKRRPRFPPILQQSQWMDSFPWKGNEGWEVQLSRVEKVNVDFPLLLRESQGTQTIKRFFSAFHSQWSLTHTHGVTLHLKQYYARRHDGTLPLTLQITTSTLRELTVLVFLSCYKVYDMCLTPNLPV